MADSFKPRGLDEALANLKKLSVQVAADLIPKVKVPLGAEDFLWPFRKGLGV